MIVLLNAIARIAQIQLVFVLQFLLYDTHTHTHTHTQRHIDMS